MTAASPAEALERAQALAPTDLVITDYHLDVTETGLDVIARLRGRLASELKVVLISGDRSPAIPRLLVDGHMRLARKPIDADPLLQLISELPPRPRVSGRNAPDLPAFGPPRESSR